MGSSCRVALDAKTYLLKQIAWKLLKRCKTVATRWVQQRLPTRNALFYVIFLVMLVFSTANMAADVLDGRSKDSRTIVWQTEPPDFLVHVLPNDVSLFSHEI